MMSLFMPPAISMILRTSESAYSQICELSTIESKKTRQLRANLASVPTIQLIPIDFVNTTTDVPKKPSALSAPSREQWAGKKR